MLAPPLQNPALTECMKPGNHSRGLPLILQISPALCATSSPEELKISVPRPGKFLPSPGPQLPHVTQLSPDRHLLYSVLLMDQLAVPSVSSAGVVLGGLCEAV